MRKKHPDETATTTIGKMRYSRDLSSYAYSLNMLERHEEAIGRADEALSLDPLTADAAEQKRTADVGLRHKRSSELNERGLELFNQGAYVDAAKTFADAFQLAISSFSRSTFLSNQAHALNALERFDEALPLADQALSLNPHSAHARQQRQAAQCGRVRKEASSWNDRGLAAYSVENYTRALECFEMASRVSSSAAAARGVDSVEAAAVSVTSRSTFLSNQAHALISLERLDEAVERAKQALTLNPTNEHAKEQLRDAERVRQQRQSAALNKRGNELFKLADYAGAVACYAKAYACAAADERRWRATMLANQAHALIMLQRGPEANRLATQALGLDPLNAHAKEAIKLANEQPAIDKRKKPAFVG